MLVVGGTRLLCVASEDLPDKAQAFADETSSTVTAHVTSTAAEENRANMASSASLLRK